VDQSKMAVRGLHPEAANPSHDTPRTLGAPTKTPSAKNGSHLRGGVRRMRKAWRNWISGSPEYNLRKAQGPATELRDY
jgi:hypothetical protein